MCGIIYTKRNNKSRANKTVIKRFQKQKSRGVQGFGYIPVYDGKIGGVKRFETLSEVTNALKQEKSDEILFHHRIPTSTPNFEDVNHPITVKHKIFKSNYYVIHNGIISNSDDLKKEHEELGIKYTTEMQKQELYRIGGKTKVTTEEDFYNDSESFSIDLALYLEGKQEHFKSKGSIAFICFETDKRGSIKNIHYGHNSRNPLILEENKGMFVLKSVGNGQSVEEDVLVTIDYKTGKTTENNVDIGNYYKPTYNSWNSGSEYKRPAGFDTRRPYEDPYEVDAETGKMTMIHVDNDFINGMSNDGYAQNLLESGVEKDFGEMANSMFDEENERYEYVEDEIARIGELVNDLDKDIKVCQDFVEAGNTSQVYNEAILDEMEDNQEEFIEELLEFEQELKQLQIRLGGGA